MDQHIYFVNEKTITRHIVIRDPFGEKDRVIDILENSIRMMYKNYKDVDIEYFSEDQYILPILTIYDLKEKLNIMLNVDKKILLFNPFIDLEREKENIFSTDKDLHKIREKFLYEIGFIKNPFIFIDEKYRDNNFKDRFEKDRLDLNKDIIDYILTNGKINMYEEKENIIKSTVDINRKELLILVRENNGFFLEYKDNFITILGKPNTENFNSVSDLSNFIYASFGKDYMVKIKNKKIRYYRNKDNTSLISVSKLSNLEQIISIKYTFENLINVKSKYYKLFLEKTNAINIFRDYKEGENIFLSKRQILINNKKSSSNHLLTLKYLVKIIYYCSELSDKKVSGVEKISGLNYKKYCQNTIKEIKRPKEIDIKEEELLQYTKEGDYLYVSNKVVGDIWNDGNSFFKCVDPNLPHLGFIPSLIGNKICIPCCYRKEKNVFDLCKFKGIEEMEIDNKLQYVNFGRLLINDRIFSKLPPWLDSYYNNKNNPQINKSNKTTRLFIKECKDLYVVGYNKEDDYNIKKDEFIINFDTVFSLDSIYKNMNVSILNEKLLDNLFIKVQFRLYRIYKITVKNYEIVSKELINFIPNVLKKIIEENFYNIVIKNSKINYREPLIIRLEVEEIIKNIIYDNNSSKFLIVINDHLRKKNLNLNI